MGESCLVMSIYYVGRHDGRLSYETAATIACSLFVNYSIDVSGTNRRRGIAYLSRNTEHHLLQWIILILFLCFNKFFVVSIYIDHSSS